MTLYCFEYTFHPVGQGLFFSGSIHLPPPNARRFVWVYDCGTSSQPQGALLVKRIQEFETKVPNGSGIDLAVISHFDKDHVNGFAELLDRHRISILLLPYIPLWQRLLIAFTERISPDDDIILFYINPVEYLRRLGGKGIERVVFVLPSDPEGSDLPADIPLGPCGEGLHIPNSSLDTTDDEDREELRRAAELPMHVGFLKSKATLTIRRAWEFVPYNDQRVARLNSDIFSLEVQEQRHRLLTSSDLDTRRDAIAKLRDIYENEFGRGSRCRNIVSLFLYGGPLGSRSLSLRCGPLCFAPTEHYYCLRPHKRMRYRDSILLTGDSYLNTDERIERLLNYLGAHRMGMVGIFQVMHHGALINWKRGLAGRISPDASIFCADPTKKYKHPNQTVHNDFIDYQPIIVDTKNGACYCGCQITTR